MKLVRCLIAIAIAVCAGCGQSAPPSAAPSVPARGVSSLPLQTQTIKSSPCAWLPPADVETIVGAALTQSPQRVLSVENPRASEMGDACLYEFPATGTGNNTITVQLTPDESGAMQTAFEGMGNVEKEFKSTVRTADASPASRWDFVSALPGGLTALRQGRIAAQVSTTAQMGDNGLALVTAMLDHIADLPFVLNQEDAAVPARDPNPCRLIARAEAESVLGALIVAPYRSRKASALVYGSGGSCAYYSAHHRALVLTPTESHGAQLFRMLGGADAKVARQLHMRNSTAAATGDWDQVSIGVDGTLHALKGDKMLSVQFITSPANQIATARLLALALPRL